MKYEVETLKFSLLIEDLKKDLDLHIKRHSVNEDKTEDFAWHLHKVNDKLREALFEIAQILPNENLDLS
jgi:hypothetical protein